MVIDKVHTITDKVSQEVVQIRATANTTFFFEILVSRLGRRQGQTSQSFPSGCVKTYEVKGRLAPASPLLHAGAGVFL